MSQMQTDRLIDASLRFWSDDVDLGTIVVAAGWKIAHLHLRGEVVSPQGRRAARHYAAVEATTLNVDEDVSLWLTTIADQIHRQEDLAAALDAGRIEGVIWLALFGNDVQSLSNPDDMVLAKLYQHHVRVLIENYTDLNGNGLPRKTWLMLPQRRN